MVHAVNCFHITVESWVMPCHYHSTIYPHKKYSMMYHETCNSWSNYSVSAHSILEIIDRSHIQCNIFFFFLRHYNFREVLTFSTSFFHLVQFLMHSFQFVISIFVMSLFTSSSHLFLGLPSDLVCVGDHSYTFFTMLLSGI